MFTANNTHKHIPAYSTWALTPGLFVPEEAQTGASEEKHRDFSSNDSWLLLLYWSPVTRVVCWFSYTCHTSARQGDDEDAPRWRWGQSENRKLSPVQSWFGVNISDSRSHIKYCCPSLFEVPLHWRPVSSPLCYGLSLGGKRACTRWSSTLHLSNAHGCVIFRDTYHVHQKKAGCISARASWKNDNPHLLCFQFVLSFQWFDRFYCIIISNKRTHYRYIQSKTSTFWWPLLNFFTVLVTFRNVWFLLWAGMEAVQTSKFPLNYKGGFQRTAQFRVCDTFFCLSFSINLCLLCTVSKCSHSTVTLGNLNTLLQDKDGEDVFIQS